MQEIKKIIKVFDLKVKKVYDVTDSYSSTVKILELENGDKVVVKIPFNKTKLFREERVLNLLLSNKLVPDLLDIWYGDEKYHGALLMSYIDGEPMSLPVKKELIFEAGRTLAEFHEVKVDMFELDEISGDWWGSIKLRFDIWINEIIGFLSEDLIKMSKDYFEKIVLEAISVDGPRLTHFDFRPGNILVRDDKIVGLIDFESTRGGATDIDFTKIAEYLWKPYPESKEVFLMGYRSVREVPNIDKHLPIYSFFNAIGGIAWCVRRDKIEDGFFDENLRTIKECLNMEYKTNI